VHGPLPFHRGALIERGSPRAQSDPTRACFPANARLECDPAWGHGHVLDEGQRTSPLLHYGRLPPSAGHAWVCTRAYVFARIRQLASASVCVRVAPSESARYRHDPRHCGQTLVEGMPTSARVMLSCYVARQLDILRSARIPCRATTRRSRHRGMHARTLVLNKRAAARCVSKIVGCPRCDLSYLSDCTLPLIFRIT